MTGLRSGVDAARPLAAERIEVCGVVQGVGFRPFVFRAATELGLVGHVGNDSSRVFIEVCGTVSAVESLAARLGDSPPPLARVESIDRTPIDAFTGQVFEIVDSASAAGDRTLVAPDTAMCADCSDEFHDPTNRRFHHPFITCTNCGPRFTIITALPYDRPATTMADFDMCDRCAAEYRDPGDRRYHAQPIACHDCGPTLRLATSTDAVGSDDRPVENAAALLGAGNVVAIKGAGGFHLACDAADDIAVARLRTRKSRPDKPFAVMVRDIHEARRLAHVDDAEAVQLTSPARPIVLLRSRPSELSALVAPGSPLVGVMLPSTPLHELLFARRPGPLVMTSANLSGEPLAFRDDDIDRLRGLCDAALVHDRRIHAPCDDSVVRLADDLLLPIRRARGYAPLPVPVGAAERSVLAVGADLKNAFCLASTRHAWMSQHIGDMQNVETLDAFERSVDEFAELYDVAADVVAVDAHPGYATTRWAHRHHADRIVEIQHHHAHIASVMAEHEHDPHTPVIGFAFDGTGYGTDGTIWGGEVLVADVDGFDRVAHLAPVLLPGGDAAIRHPHRVALAHLDAAEIDWADDLAPVARLGATERQLLRRQLDRNVACVPTTSMGRLFDAVASLLDLRHETTFEAQAAIDLEAVAERCRQPIAPYEFDVVDGLLDQRRVLTAMVHDLRRGIDVAAIALAFHHGVARTVTRLAVALGARHSIDTVALSGGVFQNSLLTRTCVKFLRDADLRVLTHHLVPPNDGGLALGQAYIAAHRRLRSDRDAAHSVRQHRHQTIDQKAT